MKLNDGLEPLPAEESEASLDPTDWEHFRQLAHQTLDLALDHVRTVRERPVWREVPSEVKQALAEPLPVDGESLDEVLGDFRKNILPYATGNIHPRFFGWVHGAGQLGGIVAEMLAAALNPNCGGRDHGAIYVERAVVGWARELFGLPKTASGLITTGTSMANLIGLTVARHWAQRDVRQRGVNREAGRLVAYASAEVHSSVPRAMEILGLGREALRLIPVDADFRVSPEAMRRTIVQDCAAGLKPFAIIGCAGTVNTGAVDDLQALASLAAEEKLWFHVDGAFGGLLMLSEKLKGRLKGIERADSIGFDFHKWAQVTYDAGCILVRQGELHAEAFRMRPAYLEHQPRGLAGGGDWPCDFGPELSRGFRALKVWFALKEHGTRRLGEIVERNCQQAQWLAQRIGKEPELELAAPVGMNIVCFRVRADRMSPAEQDRLNEEIVADVQQSGRAATSSSTVAGRRAIRVNITNHRTRTEDLEVLVDSVLEAADKRLGDEGEK
jgi:aromatic-L-amino-acid decarboxylase